MDWVLGSYTATVASDISSNFIFFLKENKLVILDLKLFFYKQVNIYWRLHD
jgi:hypothetical protein